MKFSGTNLRFLWYFLSFFQVLLLVIFLSFFVSDSSDNIFPVFFPNKMQFFVVVESFAVSEVVMNLSY